MAFIDQVQDLTSLTVSDNGELSQFLSDGVIDVTTRWLAVKPADVELFAASEEFTAGNGADLNGARIISVIRENGVDNKWRSCRKIPISKQYDVTDKESLEYASSTNPAYMVDANGLVNVFPLPGSDPNAFKVYYVNNAPQDDGGATLAHDDTTIKYFPNDKIYLVIIYAGMRLILSEIGGIANLSIVAVPPDTPDITATTISFSAQAPEYTAPTIGDATEELTTTMDADSAGYGTDADFLNYSKWFSVAGEFIEDEEDSELAGLQLQKISTYISSYNTAMQNKLNEFNDTNAEYQAQLQISIQNAQISNQEDSQKLQKFQSEIASYQADVTKEIQEHTAKLTGLQSQYMLLKNDYDSAFGIAAPKKQ